MEKYLFVCLVVASVVYALGKLNAFLMSNFELDASQRLNLTLSLGGVFYTLLVIGTMQRADAANVVAIAGFALAIVLSFITKEGV